MSGRTEHRMNGVQVAETNKLSARYDITYSTGDDNGFA